MQNQIYDNEISVVFRNKLQIVEVSKTHYTINSIKPSEVQFNTQHITFNIFWSQENKMKSYFKFENKLNCIKIWHFEEGKTNMIVN